MKTLTLCLSLPVLSLAACTGGGSTSSIELITSEEGGTLEVGGARVEFPAGALAEDTEVTAEVGSLVDLEPLEGAREDVILLAPTMTLESSASIVLDPGEPRPDSDQFALLHQYVDETWVGVDASTIINSDGMVESSIYRLAPTAVVITSPE